MFPFFLKIRCFRVIGKLDGFQAKLVSGNIPVEITGASFQSKFIGVADPVIPNQVQRITVGLVLNKKLVKTTGISIHYFYITADPVFIITAYA